MESKENKVITYTENSPAGIGGNHSIYDGFTHFTYATEALSLSVYRQS